MRAATFRSLFMKNLRNQGFNDLALTSL